MSALLQRIVSYALKALPGNHTPSPKFRINGERLFIYPDYSRRLHQADADEHELFISVGCALENAVIAANALGYQEKITCHIDGGQADIELALEPADGPRNLDLFEAIAEVQVNPKAYNGQSLSADQLIDLLLASKEPDVYLRVYDTEAEKASLLPFVEEATVLLYQNQWFRKALTHWLRLDEASLAGPGEAPPSQPPAGPLVPDWMIKFYREHFLSAEKEVKKARELVVQAAALLLFTTPHHNPEGWVNLGRSYQRMALRAAIMGIQHSLVNMPCEEPSVRRKLKEALGYVPEEPLLLMRLGHAEPGPTLSTYSRQVTQVLEHKA